MSRAEVSTALEAESPCVLALQGELCLGGPKGAGQAQERHLAHGFSVSVLLTFCVS